MAKTAAKTSNRPKKPVKETPPAPAKDVKPAFGKAAPRRVMPAADKSAKAAKAPRPKAKVAANGGTASIGNAAKVAAAVVVGSVVATARGMATLASSVTGRSKAKQPEKSK